VVPQRVAAGRLELDHLCARVGQQLGGIGAGNALGAVEYAKL
jgi:hypothetical protein